MCLAVPGCVRSVHDDEAVVDMQGNRPVVSTVLTPDVRPGQWVLVHAGFAIAVIEERSALATWDYLRAAQDAFEEELRELDLHGRLGGADEGLPRTGGGS